MGLVSFVGVSKWYGGERLPFRRGAARMTSRTRKTARPSFLTRYSRGIPSSAAARMAAASRDRST
jgi:hypothetical protein